MPHLHACSVQGSVKILHLSRNRQRNTRKDHCGEGALRVCARPAVSTNCVLLSSTRSVSKLVGLNRESFKCFRWEGQFNVAEITVLVSFVQHPGVLLSSAIMCKENSWCVTSYVENLFILWLSCNPFWTGLICVYVKYCHNERKSSLKRKHILIYRSY